MSGDDTAEPVRDAAAAVSDAGTAAPLFREVTQTHLPADDLEGPSMDAAVGDLDGDGDPDIVVANEHRPNILLLNEGDGRFRNASDRIPQVARDSEDVGIADFDGDGDLDVIVVSEDDRVNELYLNQGGARFEAAGDRLPVTGTSNAVVTPDLNGDSVPDVLIGNNGQNVALVNHGDARFRDETGERLPRILDVTQDLEMGDADGDGDRDLIVGNEDENRLLINDGSGVFTDESDDRIPLRETPEETREADFGDVDGDGDLDLLFANVAAFVENADPRNRLLVNRGDGHYRDETGERLPAHRDRSFDGDFIDVDGDGDLDIVTANSRVNLEEGQIEGAPYRVYLNEGGGLYRTATDEVFPPGVVGTGFDVEATDVDGDGRLDLYLASRGSVDRLLLGLGPGEESRVARGAPRLSVRGAGSILTLLLLALAAAPAVRADRALPDTAARPAVHVLTTGGTIASRPGEDLTGRELVAGVAGLEEAARVSVEEFSNIGSSKMTPAHWLRLARRVREVLRERPELAGVVVTHGTDTMEETAYFLHLTLGDPRPVIVTGAMRQPGTPGADGPANLMDAVRTAASPASRGRGTLVVMNDEIHSAEAVRKAHTSRPDAFVSADGGPVGAAGPEEVVYRSNADAGPLHGRFADALTWDRLPRVRIAYSYPGADGTSLRGLAGEGAIGLVVASVGRGNLSAAQEETLRQVVDRGLPVVVSSRTMAGPVPVGDPGDGVVGAGSLNPQKSRVLLGLALTETEDAEGLAEVFERTR